MRGEAVAYILIGYRSAGTLTGDNDLASGNKRLLQHLRVSSIFESGSKSIDNSPVQRKLFGSYYPGYRDGNTVPLRIETFGMA
jgi:hypothetical protein